MQIDISKISTPDHLFLWSAKEGMKRCVGEGVQIAMFDPLSSRHYEIVRDIEELEATIEYLEEILYTGL